MSVGGAAASAGGTAPQVALLRPAMVLKGGKPVIDPRADYVGESDPRNDAFPVEPLLRHDGARRPLRSYTWRARTVLDQRGQGACVGFAWAHELIARPHEVTAIDDSFAVQTLYFEAQRRDRWPGGQYPGASPLMAGTSVLAGAKVVKDLGYIEQYRWAQSLEDLASAIGFLGPAVLGTRMFAGMREPDAAGFIHAAGSRLGGHALLVVGVRIRPIGGGEPDLNASSFLVQNSWGPDWGDNGRARITFTEMSVLLEKAEVCIPVQRGPG